ncbi:MAG: hypothetical protein FWF92_03880 [Oscillospiraceae bacterium]|nr:hypothetical protein [Oscillospiraceae bacterium]
MSPNVKQITDVIELLPEKEQKLIYELIIRLLPDDIATKEDIIDIEQARDEYNRGETVSIEDII